jgi:hypothetical protein
MFSSGQHKSKEDTTQITGPTMVHHLPGADAHTAGKCHPKQKQCVAIKPHITVILSMSFLLTHAVGSSNFIHMRIHDCTISLKEKLV